MAQGNHFMLKTQLQSECTFMQSMFVSLLMSFGF